MTYRQMTGPIPQTERCFPKEHSHRKRSSSGACGTMGPGLRRDGERVHREITAILVDANWITSSFAGMTRVTCIELRPLLSEPGVLETPAVKQAVNHHRDPVHPRVTAGAPA